MDMFHLWCTHRGLSLIRHISPGLLTGRESIAKEFEDTKGVIKIRKFQDRQHNGQKKKEKQ
jgi:hypothetical protein